ncbi:hypothetical protein Tco_1022751 [Tanacetum coccineum]
MPTEMELTLEQTQQGVSYEVSVDPHGFEDGGRDFRYSISVNPDGQQQSSSISSGFVSNMLNLNQDIGVDAIFRHNAEATSLVDIPITARAEPSFFA